MQLLYIFETSAYRSFSFAMFFDVISLGSANSLVSLVFTLPGMLFPLFDWATVLFPTLANFPHLPSSCLPFTYLEFAASPSDACAFKSAILSDSNALSCVACKWTFGTTFCVAGSSLVSLAWSSASFQRDAQRHHLQPAVRPIERRLLPREAEKSRKESVRVAEGYFSLWIWRKGE